MIAGSNRDKRSAAIKSAGVAPIHAGEHLAEELTELGMSAAALARQLHVPTNRITGILNGQRAITGDTALRLGHFFGTSAHFWLNLQSLYELRIAERKAGKAISTLPRRMPLAQQAKRDRRRIELEHEIRMAT